MERPEHRPPAIFATRNPDATMHLASLAWEPLPDGTLLLECREGTATTENLRRDSFCWVVLHPGRLPSSSPDDRAEVHLVGKGFVERADGDQGKEVVRFCPNQ